MKQKITWDEIDQLRPKGIGKGEWRTAYAWALACGADAEEAEASARYDVMKARGER